LVKPLEPFMQKNPVSGPVSGVVAQSKLLAAEVASIFTAECRETLRRARAWSDAMRAREKSQPTVESDDA
jgi:hypothetical protein